MSVIGVPVMTTANFISDNGIWWKEKLTPHGMVNDRTDTSQPLGLVEITNSSQCTK